MAHRTFLKYSFRHVRPWEAAFLLVIVGLLSVDIIGYNSGDDLFAMLAMAICTSVFISKLRSMRAIALAAQAYPPETRWPYLGGVSSIMLGLWHFGVGVGVFGTVLGLACIGFWVTREISIWRLAQAKM